MLKYPQGWQDPKFPGRKVHIYSNNFQYLHPGTAQCVPQVSDDHAPGHSDNVKTNNKRELSEQATFFHFSVVQF